MSTTIGITFVIFCGFAIIILYCLLLYDVYKTSKEFAGYDKPMFFVTIASLGYVLMLFTGVFAYVFITFIISYGCDK